jgi:hypothetical protein
MSRLLRATVAFCLLAVFCVFATSFAVAKQHKLSGVAKHHKSSFEAKHRSKHKPSVRAKHKSSVVAAKHEPVTPATPHTPVDKFDCISLSQAFYEQAHALSVRTKRTIPQEFERVVSKLDEFCGEEEFEKARISTEWMNTCLKNFTKDDTQEYCSRDKGYFCAIDPQSNGCSEPPVMRPSMLFEE